MYSVFKEKKTETDVRQRGRDRETHKQDKSLFYWEMSFSHFHILFQLAAKKKFNSTYPSK